MICEQLFLSMFHKHEGAPATKTLELVLKLSEKGGRVGYDDLETQVENLSYEYYYEYYYYDYY